MTMKILSLVAIVGTLLFPARAALGSDLIGVYAVVGKVVLEPDEARATKVRICGTFARAIALSGGKYSSPEDGYLYYRCKPGEEEACRMQWQDIGKAAGTGRCIGFGSRYPGGMSGRVRTALPPVDPDEYQTGMGVVMMPF